MGEDGVIPLPYLYLTLFLLSVLSREPELKAVLWVSLRTGTLGAPAKCHTAVDAFIFCSRFFFLSARPTRPREAPLFHKGREKLEKREEKSKSHATATQWE